MNVAPIVQYVGAQAANERSREHILKVLAARLQPEAASTFKPVLDAIEDAQRLEVLFDTAIEIDSVEEFRQVLEASGNHSS